MRRPRRALLPILAALSAAGMLWSSGHASPPLAWTSALVVLTLAPETPPGAP